MSGAAVLADLSCSINGIAFFFFFRWIERSSTGRDYSCSEFCQFGCEWFSGLFLSKVTDDLISYVAVSTTGTPQILVRLHEVHVS